MVRHASSGVRPTYFLDLAHPRNFAPALADLPGVTLFDLEDVSRRVEAAREARSAHVPRAEAVVEEEVEAFQRWHRSRESTGVLKAVREQVLNNAMTVADRYAAKAPEEQREQMRQLARAVAREEPAAQIALEALRLRANGHFFPQDSADCSDLDVGGLEHGCFG